MLISGNVLDTDLCVHCFNIQKLPAVKLPEGFTVSASSVMQVTMKVRFCVSSSACKDLLGILRLGKNFHNYRNCDCINFAEDTTG